MEGSGGGAWLIGAGCCGADDMAGCSVGVDRGTMGAGMGPGVVGDTSWAGAAADAAGARGGSVARLAVWGCCTRRHTCQFKRKVTGNVCHQGADVACAAADPKS